MYPILKAEKLADKIYLMVVEAPRVARACEPGEFVIVKMGEEGASCLRTKVVTREFCPVLFGGRGFFIL